MDTRQKVTIYTTSEFFGSVVKREGYLLDHGRIKFTQYDDAPFVKFVPRGKRNPVSFVKGYRPYLVICDGWDCPDPAGMFGEARESNGMIVKESKYSSFDDRYKEDFDAILDAAKVNIVADYREKVRV